MSPMLKDLPGHRVTTRHFQAAYPFQTDEGLGSRGTYIGQGGYGSAFVFDPWELYAAGVITNPNMMVFGLVGSGKSALIKTMIWRQSVFRDRRAVVVDPKGEYGPLARALGGEPIRIEPGGKVRLNPLNPQAGPEAQLALLLAVTTAALTRPLGPAENAAATQALRAANSQHEEPTIGDVVELLFRPTPVMAKNLSTTPKQLAADARDAALALKHLCDGPLAGMFDGKSEGVVDLDNKLTVLDMSAVNGGTGVGILMACASAWLQAEIMRQRREHTATKNLWIVDEGWKILAHEGVGEWLQESYKLSRAHGISNVMVLHRLSDLTAAGAAGTRVERLASGLIEDTGTHVIYRQSPDALKRLTTAYGLSKTEGEVIVGNRKGESLWIIGERRHVVRHDLSPQEHELVYTDERMVAYRQEQRDDERQAA